MRDRFKVIRADARPIAAKVVNLKAGRNRTHV